VGRSFKLPDRPNPSPFRRPRAQGCGDRLRPGFGKPRIGALLYGQTLKCPLRKTHFRAAIAPQMAAVEPRDWSERVLPGALGRKSAFEFPILRRFVEGWFIAPKRFKNRRPVLPPMPTAAWINPPPDEKTPTSDPVARTLN